MSPHTVHLIAQDIRQLRGMLTAREKWVKAMPPGEATIELSRVVEFWRDFIAEVESRLLQSDDPREWVKDRKLQIVSSQPR